MTVNISKFSKEAFEESKPFTPVDPLGNELEGVKIWVRSSKAEEPAKIVERTANELNSRQFESQKTGKLRVMSFKRIESLDTDLACSVVTNFEGISTDNGPLEYNEENKRALLTDYEWIRKQVLDKANEADFFYKSSSEA